MYSSLLFCIEPPQWLFRRRPKGSSVGRNGVVFFPFFEKCSLFYFFLWLRGGEGPGRGRQKRTPCSKAPQEGGRFAALGRIYFDCPPLARLILRIPSVSFLLPIFLVFFFLLFSFFSDSRGVSVGFVWKCTESVRIIRLKQGGQTNAHPNNAKKKSFFPNRLFGTSGGKLQFYTKSSTGVRHNLRTLQPPDPQNKVDFSRRQESWGVRKLWRFVRRFQHCFWGPGRS